EKLSSSRLAASRNFPAARPMPPDVPQDADGDAGSPGHDRPSVAGDRRGPNGTDFRDRCGGESLHALSDSVERHRKGQSRQKREESPGIRSRAWFPVAVTRKHPFLDGRDVQSSDCHAGIIIEPYDNAGALRVKPGM